MSRLSHLLVSEQQRLIDWGVAVARLFPDEPTAYQVGSSLRTRDFRDVDVRQILADDEYDALAQVVDLERLRLSVSLWGQQATGLPIDWEMQRMSDANAEYPGPRYALFWPPPDRAAVPSGHEQAPAERTYPADHGWTPHTGPFSDGSSCRVILARHPCDYSKDDHDPALPPEDLDVFGYRRGRFSAPSGHEQDGDHR